jgi:glycosyltransferase involved in cell wall biosynthesis
LPNNDWVDGKSGLKAIQYLSFGIPTVATNVGNTPNVINHGEEGLLVKTKKEWVSALKKLITDKELRRQMGKKARIKAEEKYSQKIVCDSYVKVLDLCAGKNL